MVRGSIRGAKRRPSVRAACLDLKKKRGRENYTQENNFQDEDRNIGGSEMKVCEELTNRPGNTNFQLRCATLGK